MDTPQWEYFWLRLWEGDGGAPYWGEVETKFYPARQFSFLPADKKYWLNELGEDGWELAGIFNEGVEGDFPLTEMYFKRQLQP